MAIIDNWTDASLVCTPEGVGGAAANNVSVYTEVNAAVSGNVLDNDIACVAPALTRVTLTGTEISCTVSSFDTATGDFTVNPDTDFTGVARFTYNIECDNLDGFGYQITDTAVVYVYVNPAASAEIGSITHDPNIAQIVIDPATSTAWYYRIRIDEGNDASVDYTSAIIPNPDPDNPLSLIVINRALNNGDLIYLDSSNVSDFSSFDSATWLVPDTGTNTIDDTSDLTAVDFTLQGVFDPATTERNFRVVIEDYITSDSYGEFTVTGVDDNPSSTVDLDALGIDYTVRFSFTVYPYDEIGEAVTGDVVTIDLLPQSEEYTISTLNTFPSDISKTPYNNNFMRVEVNGIAHFYNEGFTRSDKTLTWLSPDGFDLEVGYTATIRYWTLEI